MGYKEILKVLFKPIGLITQSRFEKMELEHFADYKKIVKDYNKLYLENIELKERLQVLEMFLKSIKMDKKDWEWEGKL